jgi:hypothetical protein
MHVKVHSSPVSLYYFTLYKSLTIPPDEIY